MFHVTTNPTLPEAGNPQKPRVGHLHEYLDRVRGRGTKFTNALGAFA